MTRFALLLLPPLLAACANLKVTRNDSPKPDGAQSEIKLAYVVWGFVPVAKLPPAPALCPKGHIESVEFHRHGQDGLLTWLTLGFYVPHRATVICGK